MRERLEMVSTTEAVKYGFSMIWFFIATGSGSMILILSGIEIMNNEGTSSFIGFIISFTGIILFLSSSYGAIYKLQSDSVMTGNIKAEKHNYAVKSSLLAKPRPPEPSRPKKPSKLSNLVVSSWEDLPPGGEYSDTNPTKYSGLGIGIWVEKEDGTWERITKF